MNRRQEPRFVADEPAQITLLGVESSGFDCRIVNRSRCGVGLLLPRSIPAGAAVRIEAGGAVLLGEICYCGPVPNGFAAGVEVEQVLVLTEQLLELRRRLLEPDVSRVRA